MSALPLGLPLSRGPVRCSRAARALLLRCPQTHTRAAPAARSSSALALGLPRLRTTMSSCRRPRVTALARLGGERELGGREAERLLRVRRVDALHLEQHASGLHHRHPDLRRALALAHTGLGWFLGERLVGEDAHPHAPAALDVARERDARPLDLARREPAALDGLQAVVAEGERGATPRHALAAALLHLAPLDLLRSEHDGSSHAEGGALLLLLPGQDLAAEDPHLDADDTVGGLRLGGVVVHVGAQRVQRHAALAVPLRARDLRAAQPARRLDADALRAHAHGARHRLFHGTAERDPPLELEGHVLAHQLRVEVRAPHLVDVEEALLARQLGELLLELLDLGALLPDHDARAGAVDVDLRLVRRALDLDLGDAGVVEALLQEAADLGVLVEQIRVLAPREPARVPVLDHAQAETFGMDFLTHAHASPPAPRASTTTVMWLVRLKILVARPCARGMKRLAVGPSSTKARFT